MAHPLQRLQYAASQTARVAWYLGHFWAVNRVRGPLRAAHEEPFRPSGGIPKWQGLLDGIRSVFEQDWRNIEAGYYKPPEMGADPLRLLEKTRAFFKDVPKVDSRRMAKGHDEVKDVTAAGDAYPRYYRQNFHYQTDGWLSDHSAEIYDTQVETLFSGTADAMRRHALRPVSEYVADRDQRELSLLDIGCGTGRLLREIKRNWPRLACIGMDLSPNYLAKAERALIRFSGVNLTQAGIEDLPVATASQDIVTCVYLFHELPPKVRRQALAEIAHVLKPGGRFILLDSLQTGDRSDFDGLLEFFPEGFHEPYFSTYVEEDFAKLLKPHGLFSAGEQLAYLSKVMVFDKAV